MGVKDIFYYLPRAAMPQAALPDLNQAIITYRHQLTQALGWRDPNAIFRAVSALNGCLSEKFKLSFIPWPEYKERMAATRIVDCPHCKDTHAPAPYRTVRSRLPPAMRHVLGEEAEYRLIDCPATGKEIWLGDPDLNWITVPANIYGVAGDPNLPPAPLPPPHRTPADLATWGLDFDSWAATLASIVEDRCRLFRASYTGGAGEEDEFEDGAE